MVKKSLYSFLHTDSMHDGIDMLNAELTYYKNKGKRNLPWRHLSKSDPERFYEVLVSEMMLQQTQVSRVAEKYTHWMSIFPDMPSLADAPFIEVLAEWNGLGYSRRARYLLDISKQLAGSHPPRTVTELVCLKGIGVNTAGAILAYYDNQPEIFVETNIRTVLFHHFFTRRDDVSDDELRAVMKLLIDKDNPREWYWAMMDYGSVLKKQVKNIHKSKHYKKQSKFEGSARQLRSHLLRQLVGGSMQKDEAEKLLEGREYILDELIKEKMVTLQRGAVSLAK